MVVDAVEPMGAPELGAARVADELCERGLLHLLHVEQRAIPPVHEGARRDPQRTAHDGGIRRANEPAGLHARARIRGAA